MLWWGDNQYGQLGRGHAERATDLAPVPGLTDVIKVVLDSSKACAITSRGELYCWGSFTNSTQKLRLTPTKVTRLSHVVDAVLVTDRFCALTASGQVSCFRSPEVSVPSELNEPVAAIAPGRIGYFSEICWLKRAEPQCLNRAYDGPLEDIAFVDGVAQISFGPNHSCAVLTNGSVRCHGGNEFGQLGAGELLASRVPLPVEIDR